MREEQSVDGFRGVGYVLDLRAELVTSISLPLAGMRALSSGSGRSGELERPDATLPPGLTAALCWISCSSNTAISCRETDTHTDTHRLGEITACHTPCRECFNLIEHDRGKDKR